MIRKHFRLKRIALGLAFAAFVAPAAQAAVYVDGPTPGLQAGYIREAAKRTFTSEISVQATVPQQRIASEISVQATVPQQTIASEITVQSPAAPLGVTAAVPVVTTSPDDGFSWSDAGIGALVAFAAALMLVTGVVLGRRYRSRPGSTGLAST